jgi:hypothetical protein
VVGRHARCWARHQTITDPAHRDRAHELAHRAAAAKDRAAEAAPTAVVVEARDLSVYDTVFGISPNAVETTPPTRPLRTRWPDGYLEQGES